MRIKFKKKINKILVFITMILIAIFLALFILGFIYHLHPKLTDFKIESVTEEDNHLYLNIQKCYSAINYNVVILNDEDNIVYEKNSNTNVVDISDLILDYNEKVRIKVITTSEKDEVKESSNIYEYINKYASFNKVKDHFVEKNKDVVLYLNGAGDNNNYYVELFYKGSKISKINNVSSIVNISYDSIVDYEGRITARLYNDKNRVVSIFNFFLNAPVVSNFKIISPSTNFETIWDDIDIYYEGGENATTLNIKLYSTDKKKKILNTMTTSYNEDGHITLPASFFKTNTSYVVEITASYEDYNEIGKFDRIVINVLDKETVKPVYVDKNFTFIKKDTEVSLSTDTKDAIIYYTLDGSKPNRTSFVYANPIKVSSNITLMTYAVRDNMYDSEINTYKFKIKEKNLVVYLSPSNQGHNYGVSAVGYTTEKEQMNKLTDYLEQYLKDAGIKVYRNKSTTPGGINSWLKESNMKGSDFHFAIHSNGSVNHDTNGMEIYVDNPTSQCLSIASNIYKNLYEIYPYKDEKSNRGVKYANGSLGEANDNFIKCGSLIEIAYHDDYNDALWIMENMEPIARNIADTIIDFYQVNN